MGMKSCKEIKVCLHFFVRCQYYRKFGSSHTKVAKLASLKASFNNNAIPAMTKINAFNYDSMNFLNIANKRSTYSFLNYVITPSLNDCGPRE